MEALMGIKKGDQLWTKPDLHPGGDPNNRLPAGSKVTATSSAAGDSAADPVTVKVDGSGTQINGIAGWFENR